MSTRTSRRVPWPWDVRIATTAPPPPNKVIGDLRGQTIGSLRPRLIGTFRGVARPFALSKGFMLLPQPDSSLLVARKQTSLENLYPSTAEYDSAPVYRERTFQFRPTGGFGASVQAAAADRRYHYAINVWLTGGNFGKGPLAHAVQPLGMPVGEDARYMVRRFIEVKSGTAETLFYIANQNVFRRVDDTNAGQAVDRTRAGHFPLDMARFTGAFAGAQDCLYVSWDDGVLEERTPAGTWATATLPAGFGAYFLEVVGDELWAADRDRSVIRKCTGDPKLAGSWAGPILIGTPSIQITAIRQTQNRLAIFKANSRVFTINQDGTDNDLFPGIETTIDPENGRSAAAWVGSLWFRAGRAWYQLDLQGGPVLAPKGPGRNLGNLSEVRGPVQCLAGWNTQTAFCVIYNGELNNSYLMTYGSWVPKADPGSAGNNVSGTAYTFIDQYDGALKKWVGRKASSLFVSNIPSEARLYAGFTDGGYDWIKLVPYPLLPDQGAEYTLEPSFIVMPLHHAMFQSDNKHWPGASIFGPRFPTGSSVTLGYRLAGASIGTPSQAPTGDFKPFGEVMQFNGQRTNPTEPVGGKAIEMKITLDSIQSDRTPVLEGIGLHERLVPAFRRDYTMTVDANEYIARRDGASTRQSGVTIRRLMQEAASSPASITLELPDETLNDVALFAYEERQVPHNQRGGQGWAIGVQATQFTIVQIYGTVGRLRGTPIGDLRGWTVVSLKLI
jgi:hypothetical protein